MTLRVSVVVPVLDMADTIGACLAALDTQNLPRDSFEVIVVDNGSTDGTPEVVKAHGVTLLHEAHPGAAAARNRGIAEARGEVVAFTDADCVPSRTWLSLLLRTADETGADVVAGPLAVLDPEQSLMARYSAALGQYDPSRTLAHPVFPYATTANLCLTRELLARVNGFDAAFPTFDAADLLWRLSRLGPLRSAVERRALVFYRTRSDLSAFARQNYGYGLGTGRLWSRARQHDPALRLSAGVAAAWVRRMRDGLAVARSAADGSAPRTLQALGLHAVRELAIAAGFVAAQFEAPMPWRPPVP